MRGVEASRPRTVPSTPQAPPPHPDPSPPKRGREGPSRASRWRHLYAEPLRLSARLTAALALPLLLLPAAGLAARVGRARRLGRRAVADRRRRVAGEAGRSRVPGDLHLGRRARGVRLGGTATVVSRPARPSIRGRCKRTVSRSGSCRSAGWRSAAAPAVRCGHPRTVGRRAAVGRSGGPRRAGCRAPVRWPRRGCCPAVGQELIPAGEAVEPNSYRARPSTSGPGGLGSLSACCSRRWSVTLRWPGADDESANPRGPGADAPRAYRAGPSSPGASRPELAAASPSAGDWPPRSSPGRRRSRSGNRSAGGPAMPVPVHGLSRQGPALLHGLLIAAAGLVLLLTFQVAGLGLSGRAPTGPAAGSVFRGWGGRRSVVVPLGALVVGLAGRRCASGRPGTRAPAGGCGLRPLPAGTRSGS